MRHKLTKKALSLLVTMAMLLSMVPVAYATETTCGDACQYKAAVGTTHYATLAEAVTNAGVGDTVTLLSDITLTDTICTTKEFTLDLAGHNITGTGRVFSIWYKPVTIKNSEEAGGKITTTSNDSTEVIGLSQDAVLNLEGGTIQGGSSSEAGKYPVAVKLYNNSILNLNGGTVLAGAYNNTTATWGQTVAIETDYQGTPTINMSSGTIGGGSENNTREYGVNLNQNGTFNMTGGTIGGTNLMYTVWANGGSNANISGSAEISNTNLIAGGGHIKISGGTINGGWINSWYSGETEITGESTLITSGLSIDGGTLTVTGGTYSSDPSYFLPANYTAVQNAENNWTVSFTGGTAVARIGETQYVKLQEAIAAAQSGKTVTLLQNIELTETIVTNDEFTLDLAGYTITGDGVKVLDCAYGPVTIMDSTGGGTITATMPSETTGTFETISISCGTLNLEGGTIQGPDNTANNQYPAAVRAWGVAGYDTVLNLAGATVLAGSFKDYSGENEEVSGQTVAIETSGPAKVNMSSGNIGGGSALMVGEEETKEIGVNLNQNGTFNMTGGTIDGTNLYNTVCANGFSAAYISENAQIIRANMIAAGGAIDISGGNLTGDYQIYSSIGSYYDYDHSTWVDVKGSVTISGDSTVIEGGLYSDENYGGKISVSGGTFKYHPDNDKHEGDSYIANGYEAVMNADGTYTVVSVGTAVAQIGATKYTSLQAAIDAAAAGETVKLLANITGDSTIYISRNLTLDLNGKSISCSGTGDWDYTVRVNVNNGTVIIKNSSETLSTIAQTAGNRALWISGGDVRLESNVTVTSSGVTMYVCDTGKFTLAGGTVHSDTAYGIFEMMYSDDKAPEVIIESGKVEAPASTDNGTGIVITGHGSSAQTPKLTVKGGTVSGGYCGISGSGNQGNTKITIEGGTVQGGIIGIYHPQAGTLTLNGGTITGKTGVYAKSGTVMVPTNSTVEVSGTGTKTAYEYKGSGCVSTGDALVLESCDYPGGPVSAAIADGTFTSDNSSAVAAYAQGGYTSLTGFITGGTFSSDPSTYVKNNGTDYIVKRNGSEGSYTYTVMAKSGLTSGIYLSDPTGATASYNYVSKNSDDTWTVYYSAPSDSGSSGGSTTTPSNPTTSTETKPDGSTTTTETKPDGTVTESNTSKPTTDASGNTSQTTTETTTGKDGVTESKTETVTKPDGSASSTTESTTTKPDGTTTESKTETTINKDGSTASTTTETTTNKDGTVTESKTEATTSTVTNKDGSTTETKQETTTTSTGSKTESTTVTTVNKDGSSTATTTATTTDKAGTVTESKTESTTSKNGTTTEVTVTTETKANGTVIESKTATTTQTNGSSSSTTTATTTKADGTTTTSKTTATTSLSANKSTGTVTETKKETTTTSDGVKSEGTTVTQIQKDGTVTSKETVKASDSTGTTATKTTTLDAKGEVTTTAEAAVSAKAVTEAAKTGEAVTIPVEVTATKSASTAPTVSVSVPKSAESVKVELPVQNVTSGTVAVIVHADGTEEIVKTSIPTEDGVALTVEGDVTVKVIDNSKIFKDVHPVDHWAQESIDFVSSRELFTGKTVDTFAPQDPTTRAQLMTVLARMDGADTSEKPLQQGMNWAVESGVSDGSNPNNTITRQQLAAMLYRYAGSPETNFELTQPDAGKVSNYAVDAMRWAVENGIINGKTDGTLDPHGLATRAQVAAMMARYCNQAA